MLLCPHPIDGSAFEATQRMNSECRVPMWEGTGHGGGGGSSVPAQLGGRRVPAATILPPNRLTSAVSEHPPTSRIPLSWVHFWTLGRTL